MIQNAGLKNCNLRLPLIAELLYQCGLIKQKIGFIVKDL